MGGRLPLHEEERKDSGKADVSSMWLLIFNALSTVGIIQLNKYLFTGDVSFGYPAALSNVHYLVTWLGVAAIKIVDSRLVPSLPPSAWRERNFVLMVLLIGTVTPLNNTALKYNSAGFYQIAKTAVTPFVVAIEYVLDGKLPTRPRAACLAAVCGFVFMMSRAHPATAIPLTATDRFVGLLSTAVWIPLAAGYKVQFARLKSRASGCSTLGLMYELLPYALAVQTCLLPVVDPPGLLDYEWTPQRAAAVFASGLAAFLVNWSGFLVVGNLGAIAHILLGQFKAASTILLAAMLFGERYSAYELLTASAAMLSICAYTVLR